MKAEITIVIPNKNGDNPNVTINSLYKQTLRRFDIVVINDFIANANIARNRGLELVQTPYVLFSDNDIEWQPRAIEMLYFTLVENKQASYSYGHYIMEGKTWCNRNFDAAALKKKNFISTMSLVRTPHHPGFDPNIKRLQDWDVWLTMLASGKTGIYTGTHIFNTKKRAGITYNSIGWNEALQVIKNKHGI